MGFLRDKYTREYFLGFDENGNKLHYGAAGGLEYLNGQIFDDIKLSLDLIDSYSGKNILEIGFGRGEVIKYVIERDANSYYGIDFSESAYNLAQEYILDKFNLEDKNKVILICDDALEHIKQNLAKFKSMKIDTIIMLDVIEHIPCNEMRELLSLLSQIASNNSLFLGHTPFYEIDEDYIKQGEYLKPSTSDLIVETKGMHCNKYTEKRFYKELSEAGFLPFKEGRLFVKQ